MIDLVELPHGKCSISDSKGSSNVLHQITK